MPQQPQRQAPLGHPLAHARAVLGWSLEATAARIAQAGREIGLNLSPDGVQKVWRWENRGVRPDTANQRALARAMGVAEDRMRLLGWPRWLPGAETVMAAFPFTTQGAVAALQAHVEDALLFDRRGFMTASGAAVTAAVSGWVSAEPDRLTACARGGRLDEETVAWVEERVPGLRRLDDRLSGDSVLRLAQADLHMVTELITHSSYPAALGQRLLRTAAELAYLAGWVAFDTGLHSAAQRHYLTALHAAHAASDRPLGANVLAGMAFQATLAGTPAEAVRLAGTAAETCGDASPRVRALLASRQARAHARAGDQAACARALNRAEGYLARADAHTDGDPAWVYYFDSAELTAQEGACFVDLGTPRQAVPVLARALADQDLSYVRDRTIYTIRLARACLQAGDLEYACDLAAQAAALAHSARSHRGSQEVNDFRAALRPHRSSPAVATLNERIAALAA